MVVRLNHKDLEAPTQNQWVPHAKGEVRLYFCEKNYFVFHFHFKGHNFILCDGP